ncbi:MAG: hypothetical protein NPIRA04_16420 [Nitrospirales bacterium]|nr:MAG: hypothetical protein NPIRA04_16420 [Nitrospirales bacterium]
MTDDHVSDDEELYRNVRGALTDDEYFHDPHTGQLIITAQAFRDRKKEPSVDRAKLRDYNPDLSRMAGSGIVSLITEDVRAIGTVQTKSPDGQTFQHAVDVEAAPIPSKNEAHALITVSPEFFGSEAKQKHAFSLLRRALATLASKNGWTLEPNKS